jgi:hypothetical protein
LNAGRTNRLLDKENTALDQPVLAYNVIFPGKTALTQLASPLWNACMWPVGDDKLVGKRGVCSAVVLAPDRKVPQGMPQ